MANEYKPPIAQVGDMVWWRQDRVSPPIAAIITDISGICVDLAVLHACAYNFSPKRAVRHIDHPDREYPVTTETGVWEHRPAMASAAKIIPPERPRLTAPNLIKSDTI